MKFGERTVPQLSRYSNRLDLSLALQYRKARQKYILRHPDVTEEMFDQMSRTTRFVNVWSVGQFLTWLEDVDLTAEEEIGDE